MILILSVIVVPFDGTTAASPVLSLSPSAGAPGTSVALTGHNFEPNAHYDLTWDGSTDGMPRVKADRFGSISASIIVPGAAEGLHAVSVGRAQRGKQDRARASEPLPVVWFDVRAPEAAPPAGTTVPSTNPSPTSSASAVPTATATSQPRPTATVSPSPTASPAPTYPPTVAPTPTPVPTPKATPPPTSPAKLSFGLGPAVDSARNARLTLDAPVSIMSTWFNGAGDLGWTTDAYHQGMYDQQYAAGRAVHLIIWTGGGETAISTKYGTACGRPYPLSDRFLGDMEALAKAFNGPGTLYVTLFTEFQTFACTDNAWNPNAQTTAYWRALKDRYLEALAVFHAHAPASKVSLGWGGWQAAWDDPAKGGGRSMFGYFADVMSASDFQSFQAMESDSNVSDVRAMVNILNDYGKVMLAHYKPNNGSQAVFDADVRTMFTDTFMAELTGAGLFAWSFMDQANLSANELTYAFVRDAVRRYGQ
jgi:hypothetical protein